jgi:hypothetical protein
MIILDIGLLVSILVAIAASYIWWQTFAALRAARKYIAEQGGQLVEHKRFILRLTHELEKHGCDDALLLEEARKACEPFEPSSGK